MHAEDPPRTKTAETLATPSNAVAGLRGRCGGRLLLFRVVGLGRAQDGTSAEEGPGPHLRT
jgi:hypothetical protein